MNDPMKEALYGDHSNPHSLQKLLSVIGENWRFFTASYTHAQFIELVAFYMPNTTPSERESLAKELESLSS